MFLVCATHVSGAYEANHSVFPSRSGESLARGLLQIGTSARILKLASLACSAKASRVKIKWAFGESLVASASPQADNILLSSRGSRTSSAEIPPSGASNAVMVPNRVRFISRTVPFLFTVTDNANSLRVPSRNFSLPRCGRSAVAMALLRGWAAGARGN